MSAPLWPTWGSPCKRRTARRSSPVGGSSSRYGPSSCTRGARCASAWSTCPAVNTPQFDWCKTTLDRHPQPVPPIYQPEVAARCIVDAAQNGRRTKVVGVWNKLLVMAGSLFPGLGNSYAALGAWESQLTDVPISPDRKANLHGPVDAVRDHGAHGMFDDRAGGLLDPSFLRSLPGVARTFAAAWRRMAETKAKRYGRSVALKTADIR